MVILCGMGGGVEWRRMRWVGPVGVGGFKNPSLGHHMCSHDTQTLANATPGSVGESQVPTILLAPSIGAIVVTFDGRQNALHENRPVNNI